MSNSSETTGREVGRTANMTLISPSPSAEAIDISGADHAVTNPRGAKGLFIGSAGNVTLTMADASNITFTGVVAGTILPVQFTVVVKATTTADDMVALC